MNRNRVFALDYAAAGVMLQIHTGEINDFDSILHNYTVESMTAELQRYLDPNFDKDRTEKIMRFLSLIGVGQFFDDPFATQVFQVRDEDLRQFLIHRVPANDVYGKAWNLGLDWIKSAFRNDAFWPQFDSETIDVGALLPPPKNAVISIDHNSEAFRDASEAIDELLVSLHQGNDIGGMSTDDVEIAQREVIAIKEELTGGAIRLPEFGERARSVLGWIAKQAAGAVVGALALAALGSILKFLAEAI